MTSSATMPIEIVKLQPLGDANAASCEGDFCEVPEHHNQAVINRRLDDDAV